MSDFCSETLRLPQTLRPRYGVVRSDDLAVSGETARACRLMLHRAGQEAEAMQEQARAAAAAAMRQEQQRVAAQATTLLQTLQHAHEQLLDGVETLAAEMTARAFALLVADLPAVDRIAASVRRVREQAPARLSEAVAWVHPEELDALDGGAWQVKADAGLARGSCRLEASSGQWFASFELAADALADALAAQAREHAPPPGGVDES